LRDFGSYVSFTHAFILETELSIVLAIRLFSSNLFSHLDVFEQKALLLYPHQMGRLHCRINFTGKYHTGEAIVVFISYKFNKFIVYWSAHTDAMWPAQTWFVVEAYEAN
jgi:hypothetical protein